MSFYVSKIFVNIYDFKNFIAYIWIWHENVFLIKTKMSYIGPVSGFEQSFEKNPKF